MSTNYYAVSSFPLPARIHIGKSSTGWAFGLHVMPELGINSLQDWIVIWSRPGVSIVDEYDRSVTPEHMQAIITARPLDCRRHADDTYSAGHGEGTWDLRLGEFS